MRKIGVLLLFVLFVGIARAEINIDGFDDGYYNLGDVIVLDGNVHENVDVSGRLEIDSVCDNQTKLVFFSLVDLPKEKSYTFHQELTAKEEMLGDCYFQILLKDSDGEVVNEELSNPYTVTRKLRVEGELNILSQKPGEEIIISGVVRKDNGLRVGSGTVAFTLDSQVYSSALSDGAFSRSILLPENIGSGQHDILIEATDLNGNEGSGNVSFKVLSIPTELQFSTDKSSYRPGENVIVNVFLKDQSGKNIEGSSTLRFVDPSGNEDLTKVVDNGDKFEISLSTVTSPGTWTLEVESKDFKKELKLYVEEIKDKKVVVLDNKMIVSNIGNVVYDEPIEINLKDDSGETYNVVKKTILRPNQTIEFDLNK